MTDGAPPAAWVAGCLAAQDGLLAALRDLDDAAARRPSLLPGWSVGHVLTHIARNADSVVWRLEGAAAGEVSATSTPVVSSSARRRSRPARDVRPTCSWPTSAERRRPSPR